MYCYCVCGQVACQWVEGLRDKLRRFWSESIPLFFLIMWVVVVGVAGSAVIIKILDLLFPTCEHGYSQHWPCIKCMAISFSIVDLNTAGLEVVYGLVCWISHINNTCFSSVFLRGFFHLNPETLMPDDEKQRLIDNMEGETTEKSILIEKWWMWSH